MKNTSKTKISIFILSLALLICAVFAMSASAEESTTTPEIFSQNVKYTDKFCLMYAVKADTVSGGSVTLNLYEEEPVEGLEPAAKYTVKNVTSAADSGAAYDAYIFTTAGVPATALDKVFYVQAEDANGNKSAVKSYSVVEYLYTRLADETKSPQQEKFYKGTIEFGTGAQEVFLSAAELEQTTLISNYCYVSTVGCTINGKNGVVVPQGKPFTVVGDKGTLAECTVTTYDTYDTKGTATETIISGSTVTITDSYRANIVAGAPKTYKAGTITFEDYAVGAKPVTYYDTDKGTTLFWSNTSSVAKNYASVTTDPVHGNVLPITFKDGNVNIYPVSSQIEAANATSFELSFDIKFDSSEFPFTTTSNLVYTFRPIALSAEQDRITFKEDNANDGLWMINNQLQDVKANEWNNIRIIIRNGDSKPTIEIYINNDTATPDISFTAAKEYKASDIKFIRFAPWDNNHEGDVTVYFDNVWCGHVE